MSYRSLAIIALVGIVESATADVIYTNIGGKIEGTIDRSATTSTSVTIKTRYGTYKISRSDIKKIDYQKKEVEEYKDKAKEAKSTADDQFRLALWCLERGESDKYRRHLERVLELDPNHREARTRLGFRLVDGEWMNKEEQRRSQGYVKYRGDYVLPQEKELDLQQRQWEKQEREYNRLVRLWQKWLRGDNTERSSEAAEELAKLENPAAVKPLMEVFGEKGSEPERRLLVDVLSRINGGASTRGLLRVAVEDSDAGNRRAAVKVLKQRKSPPLMHAIVQLLTHNDNEKVRRAADILGEMGDESVLVHLIDALVTTHKHVYEPSFYDHMRSAQGRQIRLGQRVIRPDGVVVGPSVRSPARVLGNGGFSVSPPPGKQIIVEEQKNQQAVDALKKLTGVNFGYDEERWFSWVRQSHHESAALLLD